MAETWQFDRILGQFHADQAAVIGQNQIFRFCETVPGHVFVGSGGIRFWRINTLARRNGKNKTGAKAMGGSGKIAEIHWLGNAFNADSEIAAWWFGAHF